VIAREVLRAAVAKLADAGVTEAQGDVRKLIIEATSSRHFHDISLGEPLERSAEERFLSYVDKRADRKPMSHILGTREFYGRPFKVTSDVLDPRPDTETLVEIALRSPFNRVLDLGTGSGAILATLLKERPNASGIGTDVSLSALAVADDNISMLGLKSRSQLVRSDWYERVEGQFDLIVSNPPYIALSEMDGLQPEVRDHEPTVALTDGADGLTCYRKIIEGHDAFLKEGGRIIVEIGPTQAAAVSGFMSEQHLKGIQVLSDIDGRDRVVVGHKSINS